MSALERLLGKSAPKRARAPTDTVDAEVVSPAAEPSALARLGIDVPRGTGDTTALDRVTAKPTPAEPRTLGNVYGPEAVVRRQLEAAAPDVQRGASPLEHTLSAITAGGRGVTKMMAEGLSGRNPFVQKDVSGDYRVPFVEGAANPQWGFERYLDELLPEPAPGTTFQLNDPTTGFEHQLDARGVRDAAVTGGGFAVNAAVDPAMYMGVGAVTDAGKAFRAAEVELGAARMEAAGARTAAEQSLAQQRLLRAQFEQDRLRRTLAAEGTEATRGRAAINVAGLTNPLLSQEKALGTAQQIMGRVGRSRLGRAVSEHFQPPSMRVPEALRARGFTVESAGRRGQDAALRELKEGPGGIDEFKGLTKTMGGDAEALSDALSLAHERSAARKFENDLDWLSRKEAKQYWETDDRRVRDKLVAKARERSERILPRHLTADEQARLGRSRKVVSAADKRKKLLTAPEEEGARTPLSEGEHGEYTRALIAERKRVTRETDARVATPEGVDALVKEAQRRARIAGKPGGFDDAAVSADNARDLFLEFTGNKQRRSTMSGAVHEASSVVTKEWYKRELAKEPKSGWVLVTGGGPGSGKTTGLPKGIHKRVDVVYDAASGKGTTRAVRQALDSDRGVDFWYTLRDPMDSWKAGVLPRGTGQGRVVPAMFAAQAHAHAIENTLELLDQFAPEIAEGKLKFHLVDNRYGRGNHKIYEDTHDAINFLRGVPIPEQEGLTRDFLQETERQYRTGEIPHRVYAGALAESPLEAAAARGVGAPVQVGVGDAARAAARGAGPARAEGVAVPEHVRARMAGEAEAASAGRWQRLMRAPKEQVPEMVAKLDPEERQRFLEALNAAPGDNPAVRSALEGYSGQAEQEALQEALRPAPSRSLSQISSEAYQTEQRSVSRELARLAGATKTAKAEAKALVSRAQTRADLHALKGSIDSARRMYFRGASPEAATKFGQHAEAMIGRVNVRNASMFANTVAEGVEIHALTDPQAYLTHAATPEFQRSIMDWARETHLIPQGMNWREFTEKHGEQLARKLRMTAVEANLLGRAGKLTVNGGKPVKQAFYTNPYIAQVIREGHGARSIGYARHLREAAGVYGMPAAKAPKHWRTVPNNVEGIGDAIAFEPEVADHLTRHFNGLKDPSAIGAAYDRMNQVWKSYTLGIFPVFHTRNEISDLWNATLGGLNLKWLGPAMDETLLGTRLARKGPHEVVFDDGRKFAAGELKAEMEKFDVIGSGQLRSEAIEKRVADNLLDPDAGGFPGAPAVRRIARGAREGGIGKALDVAQRQLTDNRAIELSLAIGDAREQALRAALYIDRRSRGWGPEASALWVKKHLIDYGQLSDFERTAMKRVFPFYTWTRHNAPLQFEYLFAKPGSFGAVQHAREQAGGDEGLGTGEVPLPQFLSEGLPIRSGTNEEGNPEFWRLEGTWPGADALLPISPLVDPQAATRRAMSLTSWAPQEAIEQATNTDWFRSQPTKRVPIYDWPGQQGSFLGMSMDKRAIHALQNVRLLTELNRLNPGNVFGTVDEPAYGGRGSVREYPDLAPAQRATNLLYGRGYAIDEAKTSSDWNRATGHLLHLLELEIERAEARGQTAKADAARRKYEYVLQHPETVSPDMEK